MRSHYRVVVIGGGIVGASVLYHLARKGWTDIALIERAELTAGSTWHAAAGFHAINDDPHIAALQAYTIELYREIEAESGQSVGMHMPGGYSIATTPARWEWLQAEFAVYQTLGIEARLATPDEIVAECPIVAPDGLLGGLFDPHEGAVDPHGTTHAFAIAARQRGADVILRNRVVALAPRTDGQWTVTTEHGTVIAGHVVNAGGLWARRIGRMVGVDLPLTPDAAPLPDHGRPARIAGAAGRDALRHRSRRVHVPAAGTQGRVARCLRTQSAALENRWRRVGLRHGVAARGNRSDQSRTADRLRRFPSLQRAGIRKWVNGAFTFTPDGNPLVGPVPGLQEFLGGLRLHGRFFTRRRHRQGAVELDRRRRPGHRHLRHGRRPLRCVRQRRPLPARNDGAVLCAALRNRVPERGTAGRAATKDDAELSRRSANWARVSASSGAWNRRSTSLPASPGSRNRRRCVAPLPNASSPRRSLPPAPPPACSIPASTLATK